MGAGGDRRRVSGGAWTEAALVEAACTLWTAMALLIWLVKREIGAAVARCEVPAWFDPPLDEAGDAALAGPSACHSCSSREIPPN